MDYAIAAIVISFSIVVIVAIVWSKKGKLKAKITGPGGTGLSVDGDNTPPTSSPGAAIIGSKSLSGGANASDMTGKGSLIKDTEVAQDLIATSKNLGDTQNPKE